MVPLRRSHALLRSAHVAVIVIFSMFMPWVAVGSNVSTRAVYWAIDWLGERKLEELKLSMCTVRRTNPRIPQILFTYKFPSLLDDAVIINESWPARLDCALTYTGSFDINTHQDSLMANLNSTQIQSWMRPDLWKHRFGAFGRYYVFDTLVKVGVETAMYMDTDTVTVSSLDYAFTLLEAPATNQSQAHGAFGVIYDSTRAHWGPDTSIPIVQMLGFTKKLAFNNGVFATRTCKARALRVPDRMAKLLNPGPGGLLSGEYKGGSFSDQSLFMLVAVNHSIGLPARFNCRYPVTPKLYPHCAVLHNHFGR